MSKDAPSPAAESFHSLSVLLMDMSHTKDADFSFPLLDDPGDSSDSELFSLTRLDPFNRNRFKIQTPANSVNATQAGMTEERYQKMKRKRLEERLLLEETKREVCHQLYYWLLNSASVRQREKEPLLMLFLLSTLSRNKK